jgi:simple sugar transport system permease protein
MTAGRFRIRPNECLVALAILILSVSMGLVNPVFFSLDNLSDLLRGGIVIGILALGVMVALVSGGIDVSFTAIAAFSFYAATRLLVDLGYEGNVVPAFLLSGLLGLTLGSVNAFFISLFRLPTLIVTLGTLSLFRGVLLTFVGSEYITPPSARDDRVLEAESLERDDGRGGLLPSSPRFPAAGGGGTADRLHPAPNSVRPGHLRPGGAPEAAERAGFNVVFLQFFIYAYIGLLAGVAGMVHVSLVRIANPFDLVGMELNVIAAVVLGGARITGGHGTVTGTLLGVGLVVLINNNLILLGVPPYWQKVLIGMLILLGTGLPALAAWRRRSARGVVHDR